MLKAPFGASFEDDARLRGASGGSAWSPAQTLGHAGDYDAALYVVQEEFYDQLDANGEGVHTVHLPLPPGQHRRHRHRRDAFHFETINGMRPARR